MKMAEASRICSGAGNLFTVLPNPSPTVSAKFWAGRSCIIETESIDEPRGFSEVTKGDGQGPQSLGTVMGGKPRKEEARPEAGEAEDRRERG